MLNNSILRGDRGGGGWKTLKTAIALICSAVVERKNVWWYIYKVVTF